MAIDDFPPDALEQRFRIEDSSVSPVSRVLLKVLSHLLPVTKSKIPAPFGEILNRLVAWLRERNSQDSSERVQLMVTVLRDEMRKMEQTVRELIEKLSPEQLNARVRMLFDLLVDGAKKAEETRSDDRVVRIAMILANAALSPRPIDADEVEELMRVAVDIGNTDLRFLQELVRVSGQIVATNGRISRPDAHAKWEFGFWGTRVDPQIDSVFSKLESLGLVSRIPPPNNLNIFADFQNRYALLPKGLEFANSTTRHSST